MTREGLPQRREAQIIELDEGRLTYFVSIGRFDDGRAAEVFISCSQPTSERADIARDGAVLLSIALQYHVPVETMRGAITRLHDGAPASIMGRVLDLIGDVAP